MYKRQDLPRLLVQLYPETAAFTKETMKKALMTIVYLNPSVTYRSIRNKKTKVRTDSFTVRPDHVILIPDPDALQKADFPEKKI